jgi:hypothetical protein
MRQEEKLVTDLNLLHDVIYKARVCRLAMVDGLNPYVIPLSYGFDGKHLYFHSATEGRKVDILKVYNRVCVEFEQDVALEADSDKPCEWGFSFFTVIGTGTAEIVTEPGEKNYGLNQVVKHYGSKEISYHFAGHELSSVLVFKVIFDDLAGKISGINL